MGPNAGDVMWYYKLIHANDEHVKSGKPGRFGPKIIKFFSHLKGLNPALNLKQIALYTFVVALQ